MSISIGVSIGCNISISSSIRIGFNISISSSIRISMSVRISIIIIIVRSHIALKPFKSLLPTGFANMRSDTAAHPTQSSAAQPAEPPQPELRRAENGATYSRTEFFDYYGTHLQWHCAERVSPPVASAHPQPSSAAQPACAVYGSSEETRARKFLKALDAAAYMREDNPAQANLLRELVNSLSSGNLLLRPTANVWHLDEKQREDVALAKLDQLIELVISIRTAWIEAPASERPSIRAGRSLGLVQGDMSKSESHVAVRYMLSSMSKEKRADYDFCFRANGSERFLFALVRQPSVLRGEGLENLLDDWADIRNSSEYKKAVEQIKEQMEDQTKEKAVLQNLRIQINRLRRKGEDTEDLLFELRDKEKHYERGKKRALGPTTPPRSTPQARQSMVTLRSPNVSRTPVTAAATPWWKTRMTKEAVSQNRRWKHWPKPPGPLPQPRVHKPDVKLKPWYRTKRRPQSMDYGARRPAAPSTTTETSEEKEGPRRSSRRRSRSRRSRERHCQTAATMTVTIALR